MRFGQLVIQNIIWRGLYFFSVFILNILVSRYFKADGSGWIFYVINNLSLVLLILSMCLESGATYYIAAGEVNSKAIAGFCFSWSLVASAICFFLVRWIVPSDHPFSITDREIAAGFTAYLLGVLLVTYFSAFFFAKQDFFTPNIILFGVNLLLIALLIFFSNRKVVQNHFLTIYLCSFLLQGLLLVLAHYGMKANKDLTHVLSYNQFRKIFNYSIVALATNIIFFLVYRVDYWFVRRFCNEHDLGNYIQVSKLGQLFLVMPAMVAAIIFPRAATGVNEAEVKANLQFVSRLLFLLYTIVLLGMAFVGHWLFPFLYGPSFNKMYQPFLLLAPGILSLSSLALITAWNAGKNRVIVNMKGSFIALVIIVAGDWLLIPSFGISAAAAVSSLGYISYLAYVLFAWQNESGTSTKYFFAIKKSDINWIKNSFYKEKSSLNSK